MNKSKQPFDITEWSKKQLTRSNLTSKAITGTAAIFMMIAVFSLVVKIPPYSLAEYETVTGTVGEAILVDNMNMITIETSSPVIEAHTTVEETTKAPEPYETMEDYETTVYCSYMGNLNIRSLPDTETGEILGYYKYRDPIHVAKRGNGWLYTTDGNYVSEGSTSVEMPSNLKYLGTFNTTAYCTCSICCGRNAKYGVTRTGTRPKEGRTIAVDPKVIPLHSKVVIDGHEYIAEDTGSGVNGKHIDFFIDGHKRAQSWGLQKREVYVYVD